MNFQICPTKIYIGKTKKNVYIVSEKGMGLEPKLPLLWEMGLAYTFRL